MKTKVFALWDSLRSSFWFVPFLMAASAVGLSIAMIALDEALRDGVVRRVRFAWLGGPEGARQLLSTIAGSMITVAGVVFSITLVALSQTSAQFGPRLLRNFMRDPGNQVVLGTFVSTFLYCLLVLRTVRNHNGDEFVPSLAIAVALTLAILSLGVLIYFIHHVSRSLQVSTLITMVSQELAHAVDRLFPEKLGRGMPPQTTSQSTEAILAEFERDACPIPAEESGYLQGIDTETLMQVATRHDLRLRVCHRPGSFVARHGRLALARPKERTDQALTAQIRDAFILGPDRTPAQDVEFAILQLVEIAVRALSPGVNDPFTAITCIDRLGAALCHLAERVIPSPYRYDGAGTLRVVATPVTFAEAADAAFNYIRQYGRTSAAVTVRLLETITSVAAHARREEDRAALLRHAMMIERGSREGLAEEWDRKEVEARFHAALQALQRGADSQGRRQTL